MSTTAVATLVRWEAKPQSQPFVFLLLDGEAGLYIGDRALDLTEPVWRTGWQNDKIACLNMPRHAAGNSRGSVLSARERAAGHERAGTADDVVNLSHVVMHACVVR